MKIYSLIYHLGILRSRKKLETKFGRDFYIKFSQKSARIFSEVKAVTPDIGNTIFAFNYAFTPAYIAWYKAAVILGLGYEDMQAVLWLINEQIIRTLPKAVAKKYVSRYLGSMQKKAPVHQALCEKNSVHPYDYKLTYQKADEKTFTIEITRCGMRTLAKDFNAMGMFPTVCRVDYLMFALMGAGFVRDKTLGDGDTCCNCTYIMGGHCEWSPEKGFRHRK